MKSVVRFVLNGAEVLAEIEGHALLLDVLRDKLGCNGTKEGCGKGECGACTVLIDDNVFNACLYPAMEIEGKRVTTVEGLRLPDNGLSPVQQAFVDHGGIQCGFCTPGMILSVTGLLRRNPHPTKDQICEALTGNLCRCTGYVQIIESVQRAADALADS
ncbi:MAG: (2Fe-2S)-binding protein [bacterium]|nr:(2Fe-2S)-binding protein [bacterium]